MDKLMSDYLDDKRADAFNAWKDANDLHALYVEYIYGLTRDELIDILSDRPAYDDEYFEDFLRGIYDGD